MEDTLQYETYLRNRVTELRERHNVSEHRMSLELGKSGSYIRSITSGATLPSVKELFNIISYFEITPSEFFEGLEKEDSLYVVLSKKLRELSNEDLEKVFLFIGWISKK